MVTRLPSGAEPFSAKILNSTSNLPALLQIGALSGLEESAKDLIKQQMRPLTLNAGGHAFHTGDTCTNYLVVKSGSVKVSVTTESGREIVLYRVQEGETCVLTSACLMSGAKYEADGIAESVTEAIILPKPAFEELLAASPRFRQFVFSTYGERLHSLIGLVQEIIVKHVDRRLARQLLAHSNAGVIQSTHQALANDLNTVREVITRLLNDFAQKNWIELSRGQIKIVDQPAMEALAMAL
jgi:CRP/FNR family transcriptional regulator, anaerobic regulatory protein